MSGTPETHRKICRRCFLDEIDPEGVYKSIREMIDLLPEESRTDENEYRRRLDICAVCGKLNEGTCGICGCFVELRAAKSAMHCPYDNKLW